MIPRLFERYYQPLAISLDSLIETPLPREESPERPARTLFYEKLRDRHLPAIVRLISFMVSDTVIPRSRHVFRNFGRRRAEHKQDKKDFQELTEIALAGRAGGLGLWKQFRSDASNDKLRSNVRVFLSGALEATTSFASWTLSHLARNEHHQDQIYEEVKDMDVYDPENLKQAETLSSAASAACEISSASRARQDSNLRPSA